MLIATTCPNCKALFRLPDDMAGQKVKCQKCEHVFVVPKSSDNTMAPGMSVPKPPIDMEIEDAPPPQAAKVPMVTAAPPPPPKEEVKRRPKDDDDEPARPSRRKEPSRSDRRPSRREPKESGPSGAGWTIVIVLFLGVALFTCLGCTAGIGWWIYDSGQKKTPIAKGDKDKVKDIKDGEKKKIDDIKFDNNPPPQLKPGAIHARLNVNGDFRDNNLLTRLDPANIGGNRRWPHKLYGLRLEANRSYQIDMMSNDFDAFLWMLDDANFVIASDDDGGDGLNSRIIITPQRTGVYYIEATSLGGRGAGQYTFMIQRL
jgi:predicted Zn finger-like uncharacterized protein